MALKSWEKNNSTDHVNKANYHATALKFLRQRANEKAEIPELTEAEKLASQERPSLVKVF